MLVLNQLSRSFGGLRVIEGLDLAVAQGEIVGVLGPNGAGKSTLFDLVAGTLAPTHGQVLFRGCDITQMKVWNRRRLGIGRTYQIPRPFTHMSVYENVLVAAVHGGSRSLRAARLEAMDALSISGLASQAALPAGRLSLVDLKRLELAKAIAGRPDLLLLDEIAGGLTDAECDELLEILARVHRNGATIVWIEHVIHALKRFATRLVVLYSGVILAEGAPDDVLADGRVRDVYLGA